MFSCSSIISKSLGAGALNKPYWAYKESPGNVFSSQPALFQPAERVFSRAAPSATPDTRILVNTVVSYKDFGEIGLLESVVCTASVNACVFVCLWRWSWVWMGM